MRLVARGPTIEVDGAELPANRKARRAAIAHAKREDRREMPTEKGTTPFPVLSGYGSLASQADRAIIDATVFGAGELRVEPEPPDDAA